MTTFRLPTAEQKAVYVQQQFERIAKRYDLTNDIISLGMHRLWKAQAIDCLQPTPNGSYLDVCCGTGDLALLLAKRLGPAAQVTGLDFSGNMLDCARQRLAKQAISHCKFVQGDAQNLPFADNTFDGAVISFGLRNLSDLPQGLKEMARVVKPGRQVVNLDLGHPTLPLFAPLFLTYFRHIVPIIGDLLQQDRAAYTYLPESLHSYPRPEVISQLFAQAGLINIKHHSLALGSVALHVGTVA